jgi:hypothetical protein
MIRTKRRSSVAGARIVNYLTIRRCLRSRDFAILSPTGKRSRRSSSRFARLTSSRIRFLRVFYVRAPWQQ